MSPLQWLKPLPSSSEAMSTGKSSSRSPSSSRKFLTVFISAIHRLLERIPVLIVQHTDDGALDVGKLIVRLSKRLDGDRGSLPHGIAEHPAGDRREGHRGTS